MGNRIDLSKRIIVRAPNWIGDAIMSHPVFFTLKRYFPNSEIILHCREYVKEVLPTHIVDKTIIIDRKSNKLLKLFRESRKIRKQYADMYIVLSNSFSSALIASLASIKTRIGYNTDNRGILLTHIANKEERTNIHRVDSYLKLLNLIGIEEYTYKFKLSDDYEISAFEKGIIEQIKGNDKCICIAPGSKVDIRCWPTEKYRQLLIILNEKYHITPIFLGGQGDKKYIKEIVSKIDFKYYNLAGEIQLRLIPEIMNNSIGIITNDSGLAHFSVFIDKKVIVLTGPGNPVNTKPYSKNSIVVQKKLECVPCAKNKCKYSYPECMNLISVKEIQQLVETEFINIL